MPRGFKIFEEFQKGECVHFEDLKFMNDHICGYLNNWTPIIVFGTICTFILLKHILCVSGGSPKVFLL